MLLQLDSHACQVLRAAVPFGIHAAMGFKSWFLPSIRKCQTSDRVVTEILVDHL
jgi:hypothetical protein